MAIRTVPFGLTVLLLFAWSVQAQAGRHSGHPKDPGREVQAKAADAKKACSAGDFRKGVDILASLYVETNRTTFLYNQGRCYEQNGRYQEAILRFMEYLRKTLDISPADKADTDKHIADCKRLQAEIDAKNAPPPVAPQPVVAPVPLPNPMPTVPLPMGVYPPPSPQAPVQEGTRSALPVTGIVIGSVGLVTLATAIVLNIKANQLIKEVNAQPDPAKDSTSKSYETGALVCYGVGGAALATGIVLYVIGHQSGRAEPSRVAVLPVWTPGGGALAVSGKF